MGEMTGVTTMRWDDLRQTVQFEEGMTELPLQRLSAEALAKAEGGVRGGVRV